MSEDFSFVESTVDEAEFGHCRKCGSSNVTKRSVRRSRGGVTHLYYCKQCGHKFSELGPFTRRWVEPRMVTLVLGLCFSGVPLRRVADQMQQSFNLPLTSPTILRWINEYVPLVSKFVRGKRIASSDVWQFASRKLAVGRDPYVLWIVMEKAGNFILASHIGSLTLESAISALTIAKEQSSTTPKTIETDRWDGHEQSIRTVFGDGVTHLSPNTSKVPINVNRLIAATGKLYGVKGFFKTLKGARNGVEGVTISHNYVWRQERLGNRTPAEVLNSSIKLGRDRWLSLIKSAEKGTTEKY